MKTTVIYHSADFDGIFCREIARKFLPDAELIGWDFADAPLPIPDGPIYVLDLPVDRVFGFNYSVMVASPNSPAMRLLDAHNRIVWIDHHKTSIETHPDLLKGYRIDGVAACRLAWQWFSMLSISPIALSGPGSIQYPTKGNFVDRNVSEPLAVRLAGEYDIWDKRDPDAELFQHGLRSEDLHSSTWDNMLDEDAGDAVIRLLNQGRSLQYARTKENESIARNQSFTMAWEGFKFLCINAARYNSQLFTAALTPEHDGCLGFNWDGKQWRISLYNDKGLDFSGIAKKYGGGGHPGACGFQVKTLPFELA